MPGIKKINYHSLVNKAPEIGSNRLAASMQLYLSTIQKQGSTNDSKMICDVLSYQ